MADRTKEIDNLHITGYEELTTPGALKDELALVGLARETVTTGHRAVKSILDRHDPRMIVVVGPCSIHDPEEALEYARLLKPVAEELADDLLVLMRVYFEKPRTSVGWEGLIYDPHLDGSHRIPRAAGGPTAVTPTGMSSSFSPGSSTTFESRRSRPYDTGASTLTRPGGNAARTHGWETPPRHRAGRMTTSSPDALV